MSFETETKTARIQRLETLMHHTAKLVQDLYKEIGALQAWRRQFHKTLGQLKEENMSIREDLANTRREVNETKTVVAGATKALGDVTQLVKDLQARIDANPDMTAEEISAELGSMASDLDASQQEIAAAIANVPQAAPAPGTGTGGGQTAAERAASEGNATLEQPNAPRTA